MYAELRNDVPFWGRVYKIVGICSLPPGSVATLRSSQDAPPLPLRRGDSPNSEDHVAGQFLMAGTIFLFCMSLYCGQILLS